MDEISGKRAVDKLPPTKRSGLVMRDTSSFSGRSPQPCNRLGCSSRANILKGGQGGGAGCPQKAKSVRSSVCHSGGKEISGSSSKNGPSVLAVKTPKKETQKKKIVLQLNTDSSDTSSTRDELEVPEVVPPPGKIQKGVEESSMDGVTVMEVGSSSSGTASISKSRNNSNSKNLGSSKAKSVRQQPANPNMGQCGLRNLRCNSTADVAPPNSSPPNRSLNKRKDLLKGRISEGETSSSRGRKTAGTLPSSRSGVSIPESRRTRNSGPSEAHRSVSSVRVRRSPGSPSERNTRSSSSSESRFTFSRSAHRDFPVDENASSSSSPYELSNESLFRRFAISNRPGSSSGLSPGFGPSSPDNAGFSSHPSVNWESFQQYTMEGIAEVLSALERIEQDELNYEQLVSLETNLFLSSLNVYDQHRDMRMDIDNMSYEELLALGERMGTVSTALTEEAIAKCLKRDLYQKIKGNDEPAASTENDDDTKCSICQEEYVDEDEVGRLQCEHMYHINCINQWLRLKNWCPICKGSAEPSPSSPRP
ncbi:hypothetical protein CRG98_027771 [Punica granatum]|nr:hypothetical protein CRG98_027771 [Punica granatum]